MARRGAHACGLLLTSLGLVAAMAQVPAADADEVGPDRSTFAHGELTSTFAQPPTPHPESASASFTADFSAPPEENVRPDLYVYRNSDGHLVRKVPVPDNVTVFQPRVEGDSILQLSESEHWGGIDTLTVRDVESYDVTHTFSFPRAHILGFGESWILTSSVGETTGIRRVRLQTSSGIDRQLDIDVPASTEMSPVFSTPTTPAVQDTSDNWRTINTSTGEESARTFPDDMYRATTDRYFATDSISFPEYATRLRWVDKDGTGAGQLEIPGYHSSDSFLPLGNGVAVLTVPEDGSARSKDLSPVDLETGAIGAPIARKVSGYKPLPDGRIVLGLGDTPTGRLAIVGDDGQPPRTIVTLDEAGQDVDALMLSQGDLAATWDMTPGRDKTLYFSKLDDSTPWTRALPSGFQAPIIDASREDFVDFSGGVVLTDPAGNSSVQAHTYRLDWDGGTRDFTSAYGGVVLGHGAKLLGRRVATGSGGGVDHIEIQNAKSGQPRATVPASTPYALERRWLWTLAGSTLTGTDTAATEQTKTVPAGSGCGATLDVVDRWALISCYGEARVVDLAEEFAPWTVPIVARDQSLVLGGGFVAWAHYRTDTRGEFPTLEVMTLKGDHERRTYGPIRGLSFPSGPTIAPDDSGAPHLAYADSTFQVRQISLDWAGLDPVAAVEPDPDPPVPDTASPSKPVIGALARVASTPKPTVEVSYDATDDNGVVSYDVQYLSTTPHTPANVWTGPLTWTGTVTTSVTKEIGTGDDVCFRVRARDATSNVSPWSDAPCVAAPYDDRQLTAKGKISRKSSSTAMSGTETQLLKKGAYLYRRSQKGSAVAVVAYRGPKEGSLYVYLGSKKIGTISLKNAKTARVTLTVKASKAYSGTLKLVSASTKRARIDGVAVLH